MTRHWYGFSQRHQGAYWANNDGSTSESGDLHRFTSPAARDAWVQECPYPGDPRDRRRVVTTRTLPRGHTINGPRAGYYDHPAAGGPPGSSSPSRWLEWDLERGEVR